MKHKESIITYLHHLKLTFKNSFKSIDWNILVSAFFDLIFIVSSFILYQKWKSNLYREAWKISDVNLNQLLADQMMMDQAAQGMKYFIYYRDFFS